MKNSNREYLDTTRSHMGVCKKPIGLKAEGLGSCVGVMLWDSTSGIGGMVEIVYPHSKGKVSVMEAGLYADTGIAELIRRMQLLGAHREYMQAKIAGGANMKELGHISEVGQTGLQNVLAVRQALTELDIQITAEDVGMDVVRSLYFTPEDGNCTVEISGMPRKEI